MTLLEMYKIKLYEYKKQGFKEKPSKLLAMLLLSEKNKYQTSIDEDFNDFYIKYKNEIDIQIFKVINDFNLSKEDVSFLANDDILLEFIEGIRTLYTGLVYSKDKTAEEIYTEYFRAGAIFERICYELPIEERFFILEQLENKSCLNCTNGICRVEYKDKLGVDDFGNPVGSKCIGWFNAELIGRSRVLKKIDIHKLKQY